MVLNKVLEGNVVLLEGLVNINLQKYIFDICKNKLAYTYSATSKPPQPLSLVNKNVNCKIYDDFILECNLSPQLFNSNSFNYINVNRDIGPTLFTPLYLMFAHLNLPVNYSNINRCKVNFQIPSPKNPGGNFHNTPHIDFLPQTSPIFTVIYYVNDSDGDSTFFNNDLSIKQKITPKSGNIAIFSSNLPHASSHPIDHHRYIISYSFSTNPL